MGYEPSIVMLVSLLLDALERKYMKRILNDLPALLEEDVLHSTVAQDGTLGRRSCKDGILMVVVG